MKLFPSSHLVVPLFLATLTGALAQAPVNDAFAAAVPINGALPATVSGGITGATLEKGEPRHSYQDQNASVWWRWTATASAAYRLDTLSSSFDTTLAVYTGSSVQALTQLTSDGDSGTAGTSFLMFNAVSGTTYHFAVAGIASPTGAVTLRLSPPAIPENDAWAGATLLQGAGPFSSVAINSSQGTIESGEPSLGMFSSYSRTFWWKWTPAVAGPQVICGTRASYYGGKMEVFTGAGLASLTPLDGTLGAADHLIFQPVAGTTYYIRAAFYPWAGDLMTFFLRPWDPPVNDNWAAATALPAGLPSTATGTMVDAISEDLESGSSPGDRSVWWKWTAPSSGALQVVADPYVAESEQYQEANVSVFQGTSLASLTALTQENANYPFGEFTAVSGQEYYIRLSSGSFSTPTPSVRLTIKTGPPPPANNNFASSVLLTGLPSAAINGTLLSATLEPSEPATGKTVWYRWVATATGTTGLLMNTISNSLAQATVFTGSTPGSLTPVSDPGDTKFPAVAGTTYHIQVSGQATAEDGGRFLIGIVPVPANDSFATPAVLTGLPATASGTTAGASPDEEFGFGATVWYSWTSPVNGPVVFTMAPAAEDSSYPSATISTGTSLAALTSVTGTDSITRFTAAAGTTYRIKVQTYGNSANFQLAFAQAPANDNFANATLIPAGTNATVTGDFLGSYFEDGEPGSSYQTLWWRWTAAGTGTATLMVESANPDLDLRLNTWEGTALTALSGFPGRRGKVTFQATAGTTYRIQAGTYQAVVSSSQVTLSLYTAPGNDAFAAAATLTGAGPVTATGWNFSASSEAGDPLRGTPFATHAFYPVWWKWTAPGADLVVIDTSGSHFNTQLHIYQGLGLTSLQLVRASDDAFADRTSRVSFFPEAGVTYFIRVSGGDIDRQGTITLNLRQYPAANTVTGHLQRGRAALEGGTAADIATADDHFAAAFSLAPGNTEAIVLRAITRLGRLQQQAAFTTLLTQWGFTTKRANLVRPRYLAPRTSSGIANPPPTADTAQALAFANNTLLPELAIFESALASVSSPVFSLPLTDAETQLRTLSIDAADLRILRAAGQLLKALVHTTNTFNSDIRIKTLLDLHDGKDLNAESLVQAASSFLERRAPDDRASAKAAFKAANALYQPAWIAMQNRPEGAANTAFLFYIPEWETSLYTERTEDANDAALSFDGPVTWDGTTINLSALITTPVSLRNLLPVLKWNKAVAGSAPDSTFAGALPGGTQAIANQFLRNNQLLHDVSSYLAWMGNYLSDYDDEEQAPEADPDGDGFDNFTEYVFNLNPQTFSNVSDFQASGLVPNPSNANRPYFTYTFIRLKSPAAVSYQILVSDDLTFWDSSGAQLEAVGAPIPQADGVSEQVTVRLRQPASLAVKKYLKIKASLP